MGDLFGRFRPVSKPREPKFNDAGLKLIQHFESCLQPIGGGDYRAYKDPVGIWTIGWGTISYPDGRAVRKGDVISQHEADKYLQWEIQEKSEGVRKLVKVPLNDDQFSALVSFAYNLGTGALRKSTLLRLLNAGNYSGAAGEFIKWNKGRIDGKLTELRGLTRRRMSERNLFESRHPAVVLHV